MPRSLDIALRRVAREQGKRLNEVVIEALTRGVREKPSPQRDLSDIAGTWRNDRAFKQALTAQDTIDEKMEC